MTGKLRNSLSMTWRKTYLVTKYPSEFEMYSNPTMIVPKLYGGDEKVDSTLMLRKYRQPNAILAYNTVKATGGKRRYDMILRGSTKMRLNRRRYFRVCTAALLTLRREAVRERGGRTFFSGSVADATACCSI